MSKLKIDGDNGKIRGLVRWASVPPARPRQPHEDAFNPDEPDNCFWSIEVECDKKQHVEILKMVDKKPGGAFTQVLRDYPEDVLSKSSGEVAAKATDKTFITFKKTKIKGEYDFGSIPVKDKAGEDLEKEGIGNDSECIVHFVAEPVKKGSNKKTLRLKAVQVMNLVPFAIEKPKVEDEIEWEINPNEQQEAFDKDTQDDDFDDEVPF